MASVAFMSVDTNAKGGAVKDLGYMELGLLDEFTVQLVPVAGLPAH